MCGYSGFFFKTAVITDALDIKACKNSAMLKKNNEETHMSVFPNNFKIDLTIFSVFLDIIVFDN